MSTKFRNLAVVFAVVIAQFSFVNAQQVPCFPDAKGSYYATPYYDYTPVLRTNMPYDIMQSYIIADSIITGSNQYMLQSVLGNIRLNSDTLRYGLKYLYKISDYNPLLYFAFLTTYQHNKMQPYDVLHRLDLRLIKEGGREASIITELISALYILKVRVNETKVIKDSPLSFTTIYCQVLDTIKGQTLPDIQDAMVIGDETTTNDDEATAPPQSDLIFEYTNNFLRKNGTTSATMYRDGKPLVEAGGEYIVFLTLKRTCTTEDNVSYCTLTPTMKDLSAGMFQITDGSVFDEGNDFGWGTSVPEATFMDNLREEIRKIAEYGE